MLLCISVNSILVNRGLRLCLGLGVGLTLGLGPRLHDQDRFCASSFVQRFSVQNLESDVASKKESLEYQKNVLYNNKDSSTIELVSFSVCSLRNRRYFG